MDFENPSRALSTAVDMMLEVNLVEIESFSNNAELSLHNDLQISGGPQNGHFI